MSPSRLLVLIPLAGFWALAALFWSASVASNDGLFVYALDDAYIHMGIARNFAQFGVWGVSPLQFSSSTSSPLWTLLLAAAFGVLGAQETLPLILTLLTASAVILAVFAIALRQGLTSPSAMVLTTVVAFAAPLPTLAFSGLEHVLHILVVLPLVWMAAGRIAAGAAVSLPVLVLAAMASGVRYESLFLVGLIALGFWLRRRRLDGVLVLLAGLAPVVVYGLISMGAGWHFLPNPLLLKGGVPRLDSVAGIIDLLGNQALRTLLRAPDLLLVFTSSLLAYAWGVRRWGPWDRRSVMLTIFAGLTLAHAYFAQVGWFFRYEAYLIALGLFAIGLAVIPDIGRAFASPSDEPDRGRRIASRAATVALLLLLFLPILARAWYSAVLTVPAMNDRYHEHITMARFVREFYDRQTIVLNDIGTTAFYTDAHILDMYGLGSPEPVDFRRQPGGYRADDVERWARDEGARIAILQVDWFEVHPRIPRNWVWVGDWVMPRNVVFETFRVGFFAVDSAEAPRLTEALRQFSPQVPRGIRQEGPYTE